MSPLTFNASNRAPDDSQIRFLKIGCEDAIYEYDWKEPRLQRFVLTFRQKGTPRDYYRVGDCIPIAKYSRSQLESRYPDSESVKTQGGGTSFWDLLGIVVLGNEKVEFPVFQVIKAITPSDSSPWHGKIDVDVLVHFGEEVGVYPVGTMQWNHRTFSEMIAVDVYARSMVELAEFGEKVVAAALEIAIAVLTDGALNGLKGTKLAKGLLQSKIGKKLAGKFAKISAAAIGKASIAAVTAWSKEIAKIGYKELTAQPPANPEKKVKLDAAYQKAVEAFVSTFITEMVGDEWLKHVVHRLGGDTKLKIQKKIVKICMSGQGLAIEKLLGGKLDEAVKAVGQNATDADIAAYINSSGLEHLVAKSANEHGFTARMTDVMRELLGLGNVK